MNLIIHEEKSNWFDEVEIYNNTFFYKLKSLITI